MEYPFSKPEQIDEIISRVETEVRSHAPDLTSAKGRKAIASLAYKVARSKTAFDEAGKELTADFRAKINAVDAERRKVRERLDALKAEVRQPLDDWEAAEEARQTELKDRLAELDPDRADANCSSEQIAHVIAEIEAIEIGDGWAEYREIAAAKKEQAIKTLRQNLEVARTREAERAELERLRREAAEREEADRQRREAEELERQRAAAEKAEAERQAQAERERQEAARRAAQEAEERARREAEKRETEYQRQIAEEKARAERAAQVERDRIAAEQRAAAEAQEKRERDTRIRNGVRQQIIAALEAHGGVTASIADALMDGKIPHVKVIL